MGDQPYRTDHVQRLGQRLAGVDEHVAARLDAAVVIGPADLRRRCRGHERDRPARVVHPLVASAPADGGASIQSAVAEPGVGVAVAVQVQACSPPRAPARRAGRSTRRPPSGTCGPPGGACRGRPRTISSRNSFIAASRSITDAAEVDLAQLRAVFTWWPHGPISSRWPAVRPPSWRRNSPACRSPRRRTSRRCGAPVRRPRRSGAGSAPAPTTRQSRVAALLAPGLAAKAGGLVELGQRAVPVDGHPVDRFGVLQGIGRRSSGTSGCASDPALRWGPRRTGRSA